jgi:hypothetical protein
MADKKPEPELDPDPPKLPEPSYRPGKSVPDGQQTIEKGFGVPTRKPRPKEQS